MKSSGRKSLLRKKRKSQLVKIRLLRKIVCQRKEEGEEGEEGEGGEGERKWRRSQKRVMN
jgi:hypothetical protein